MSKRESREVWSARVQRLEASGLSVAAFSRREKLKAKSLSWWRWKLRDEPAPAAFVELATVSELVEVEFANGRVLRASSGLDHETFSRLVSVVDGG